MTGKQLKNSILQWAIQGKLVPQDPNEEPASVLLEKIRAEKARLIKEGKIKKDKKESIIFRGEDNSYYEKILATGEVKCIDDEIPFEIPSTWEWCRMQEVIEFVNGRAYKKEELLSKGKYRVLRVGNFFTNDSWYYSDLELPEEKYCFKGDLLYAWSASFGPQIWDGDKTIFHYHIWNVKYNQAALKRDYLYYFLLADKAKIKSSTTGSTMIHVSMENMKPRFIPIPPASEQVRIVSQLDAVLHNVEKYENLNAQSNILNNNIRLVLRKSILQEAIQGKLVPQNPTDEPASVLLERVKEEKLRLVKEGKLKKKDVVDSVIFKGDDNKYYEQIGKNVVDITDEIPFEIPESWEWVRIYQIATSQLGKTLDKGKQEGNDYPYLCSINVYWEGISLSKVKTFKLREEELTRYKVEKGDLLICEGGDYGRCCVWDKDGDMYYQNALHRVRFYKSISPYFYKYVVELYRGIRYIEGQGQTIKHFTYDNMKKILFPLPPIEEQKQIANKIELAFNEIKDN